jgi:hypothetical protein
LDHRHRWFLLAMILNEFRDFGWFSCGLGPSFDAYLSHRRRIVDGKHERRLNNTIRFLIKTHEVNVHSYLCLGRKRLVNIPQPLGRNTRNKHIDRYHTIQSSNLVVTQSLLKATLYRYQPSIDAASSLLRLTSLQRVGRVLQDLVPCLTVDFHLPDFGDHSIH